MPNVLLFLADTFSMKILFLVLLLAGLLHAPFALAKEKLVIGCTTKCSFFYTHALKVVAKKLGLSVSIIDLSKETKTKLSHVDGIIIPGGADINPEYYLSEVEQDLQDYTRALNHLVNYTKEGESRDPFEFTLLKKYFSDGALEDLPILGICRGMQMLAVSQGIPLYVDIKTELGIRNRRYIFDQIYLDDENSVLNEIFPIASFWGFKQHHQGIRVSYFEENRARWPHLKITAYSNKGRIAESLEFSERPVLGVQFHPEKDFGVERNAIFSWLLNKARERKELKEETSHEVAASLIGFVRRND